VEKTKGPIVIQQLARPDDAIPEANIASARKPSKNGNYSLPTIHFQLLRQFQEGFFFGNPWGTISAHFPRHYFFWHHDWRWNVFVPRIVLG